MCGITGIFYFDPERSVKQTDLERMNGRIVHRGPDDQGFFTRNNVGLAMRRLSIIDLAGGHQPISSPNGRKVIVFNGEAYNFQDHRPALEKRGYRFTTHSDTEVVLALYDVHGPDFVQHINGMFGIAIWDEDTKTVLLARDRIGIKPLYYYQDDEKLVFASEIKAILSVPGIKAELDEETLAIYLQYGFTPAPHTLFRRIFKLQPGHLMSARSDSVSIRPYWKLSYREKTTASEAEIREELYSLLKSSVEYRMIADVPLGAFLSGGIDSSGIVHLMNELGSRKTSTYTIGFGQGYGTMDESDAARRFASDYATDHHEILVEPNVADLFPQLVANLDEPLADSSFIVTYLVSKLARESVTVILSGVGGDELFGGYRRYLNVRAQRYVNWLPSGLRTGLINPLLERMPVDRNNALFNYFRLAKAYFATAGLPLERQYAAYTAVFDNSSRNEILVRQEAAGQIPEGYFNECDSDDPLDKLMYFDLKTSLPEQLLMLTDKMSMATSLEARAPYLDHRVVEYAARIPSDLKIRRFNLRHIQKEVFKGRFPDYVFRQPKKGFGAPVGTWIRNELKEMIMGLLGESNVRSQGIFNAKAIGRMLDEHYAMKADHTDRLLGLITFQLWYQEYLVT